MTQLQMTGEDWLSEGDKKRQARAEATRKKAALACAAQLLKGADSLRAFISACNACNDASSVVRADDGRERMVGDLCEYANFLLAVYEK